MGFRVRTFAPAAARRFQIMHCVLMLILSGASAFRARAQTTAACCLPNGNCILATAIQCEIDNGIAVPHSSSCAGVVCTGACCLPNASCSSVTGQNCATASGEFKGINTQCAGQICGGACCHANGTCGTSSQSACTSPNVFQGLGTACGNVDCAGACCRPDGSCVEEGATGCQIDGGEFLGFAASCNGTVCTGACCLPDTNKSCVQTGSATCTQLGGAYQSHGTVCSLDCPSRGPTAFTYQGQLKHNGIPLNGQIDIRCSLWISLTGQEPGDQIAGPNEYDNIVVADGLFTTTIDFGQNAFNGNGRWLEIAVHSHADPPGTLTTLSPRQPLTPTPYSLETRGIVVLENGNVGIGTKNPSAPLTILASGVGMLQENGSVQLVTQVLGSVASLGTTTNHPLSLFTDSNLALTVDNSQHVGVGTSAPEVKLNVANGTDVELSGGGFLQLGSSTGMNLALDDNEIMARNSGGTSTLFLNNNGGDVHIGGDIDIGLEIVQVSDATCATALCPAGKLAISGGCSCSSSSVYSSTPSIQPPNTAVGWACCCFDAGDTSLARAICARVKY